MSALLLHDLVIMQGELAYRMIGEAVLSSRANVWIPDGWLASAVKLHQHLERSGMARSPTR